MGKSAEHKNLVVPAVNDTVEVFFKKTGTDTTENPFIWFFNLTSDAKAISVQSDEIAQITHINGEELKSPKNIPANGSFSQNIPSYQLHRYNQIKVKVLVANSNIEIFGST